MGPPCKARPSRHQSDLDRAETSACTIQSNGALKSRSLLKNPILVFGSTTDEASFQGMYVLLDIADTITDAVTLIIISVMNEMDFQVETSLLDPMS